MPNHLAGEASPYLKDHAENPVDWYPWGRGALERARSEDRPILLSVGYSACHWCHVMAHESFEDRDIAHLMNEHFVCIKVDREERPDIDQVYQTVVQLLGKSGGWPLTVFLTPDQKPFFAGTYFPPEDRYGMPGFPRILLAVVDAYRGQRSEIELQSSEITKAIEQVARLEPKASAVSIDALARAAARLSARFDDEHGGFGSRPKFPNTMCLDVLLAHGVLNQDDKALGRVRKALDAMRDGGIYDQLGGGFHRYSTDERWLVPHFEKMLYDNALLLRLYVDGWRVFQDDRYADTAREIVRWLLREMTAPQGGFYAAQDADSEGHEGKFFVWRPTEVREACGDDAGLACARYGIDDEGNLEGSSVLSLVRSVDQLAVQLAMAPSEIDRRLANVQAAMFAHRERRPKPFRDEKILTSWNALTISALADASQALDEPSWLDMAKRAFDFVWTVLTRDGRALRHAVGNVAHGPGFLDDQAFLGCAAIDLYEATGDGVYLAHAEAMATTIREHFIDGSELYLAARDGEGLVARTQDVYDHSVPSASSMALLLFSRLGASVSADLTEVARQSIEAASASAVDNPFGLARSVILVDRLARGTTDVVLVGGPEWASAAFKPYLAHRNLAWGTLEGESRAPLMAADKKANEPAAFVCRDHSCSPPAVGYRQLLEALSSKSLK